MLRTCVLCLALAAAMCAATRPAVYVVLWFDTEDYVQPKADDALLRLATDLEHMGVRATFKMVGEKARVLDRRGRTDVLRALTSHDIGYHTDFHSMPPSPAVYLRTFGFIEGAQEFERRERQGVADVRRIFGVTPSCYGQPGSSWAPQTFPALRRLGIETYVDNGVQVVLNEQPFWWNGVLNVFGMGRNWMRAGLKPEDRLEPTLERFDRTAAELLQRGGGVISTSYHPTEFATTDWWDGVNFPLGTMTERGDWKMPQTRTPEDAERCFRVFDAYIDHARKQPGVQFITARELRRVFYPSIPHAPAREAVARHMMSGISFMTTGDGALSASDQLQILLGMAPEEVYGPTMRGQTDAGLTAITRPAFERAKAEAVSFIQTHGRLPSELWIASSRLSLADFAATLAADTGTGAPVPVRKGRLDFERYIATRSEDAFDWAIFPEGFRAPELLEMARLQAWTLKPAKLR